MPKSRQASMTSLLDTSFSLATCQTSFNSTPLVGHRALTSWADSPTLSRRGAGSNRTALQRASELSGQPHSVVVQRLESALLGVPKAAFRGSLAGHGTSTERRPPQRSVASPAGDVISLRVGPTRDGPVESPE